jgi:hypothetical protein
MNVLVTGVGGPTPRSFVRAVRNSGRSSLQGFRFIGVDCNQLSYGLYDRTLFDAGYLVPRADHQDYWTQINHIIEAENISMAVVLPEQEVLVWAENKDKLIQKVITHLPEPALASALIDKYRLHVELSHSDLVPAFIQVDPKNYDYKKIVDKVGENFWIRGTVGSSGFGSLQIGSSTVLDNWIAINSTIEQFIATEFLPGRNLACKLLYFDGQMKRSVCAERVHYIMAKVAPSGITGNTSFGRMLNFPELVEIAEDTMGSITAKIGVKPHGIFTLDFKEDQAGRPKLTEINVRHVAFNSSLAAGGANLPADTLELLQLSDTSSAERIDYTFQQPMIFLRDVDGEPIVMPEAALLGAEQDYSLSTRTSTVSDKANGAAPIQMLMGLLNSILETSCRPALDHLQPQDRLQEDLGFDSLELAELTVRLEAETGVDVFRDGVVRTVGEILAKLNP